jgi:hypothetical protein
MADHPKETIDLTMSDDEQGDSVLLNLGHNINDMNTDTLRRHCADLGGQGGQRRGGRLFHVTLKVEPRT